MRRQSRRHSKSIAALDGPFEAVLCRVDGLLENVLDPDTGEVFGLLDRGFTLAATPAYDLVHVGASLGGGPWTAADPVGWTDGARQALVAGYATRAPDRAERYRQNRDCYELLQWARVGAHLDEWLALREDDREAVAATERAWRERTAELLAEE